MEPIDFGVFQRELDAAFHTRDDAYPAGSPEHAELQQFVARLHKLRLQQRWAWAHAWAFQACSRAGGLEKYISG